MAVDQSSNKLLKKACESPIFSEKVIQMMFGNSKHNDKFQINDKSDRSLDNQQIALSLGNYF